MVANEKRAFWSDNKYIEHNIIMLWVLFGGKTDAEEKKLKYSFGPTCPGKIPRIDIMIAL